MSRNATKAAEATVRRRRLGIELRLLRETAALSQEDVSRRLEVSRSKIQHIEAGRSGVGASELERLLDVYGIDGDQRMAILDLGRQARVRGGSGWWETLNLTVPAWFQNYATFEAAASAIATMQIQLVPGLLQTDEYAHAVISAAHPDESPQEIDKRLELRMKRQARLSEFRAPAFHAILDEAVLCRLVGGRQIMAGQLRYLVQAAELPNVTIQILPFATGAHIALGSSFVVMEFEPEDPHMAYVEYPTGAVYVERRVEVEKYRRMIRVDLPGVALDPDRSRRLIDRMAQEI